MFIHTLFENRVNSSPESIALEMNDLQMTYAELNTEANRLARALLDSGVQPGDVVGICIERSFELIAGLLAILKAGAAYLPLDTEYPPERLKYMINHSLVKKVLVNKKFSGLVDQSDATAIILEDITRSNYSLENLIIDKDLINLAYVIYTSGSTGQPKGIAMGVRSLLNLIEWQTEQSYLQEDAVTLQFTPVSFDVHFQEIFSTLSSGGRLVLVSEQHRLDTLGLLNTIQQKKINKIFLPYVALNHLCEMGVQYSIYPDSIKEITTAGEQLKITKVIRQFFEKLNGARLFNHYGPSETHVVTSFTLSGQPQSWPNLPSIGKAINNVSVHILDSEQRPLADGQEGELFLSGVCLAEGYLNSPELTAERFIRHPQLGRLYRTGDLGFINPEGNIVFLGRKDSQIKMRGYRIELGEIEIAIGKNSYGGPCVVNVMDDGHDSYLCAYVTGHSTYDGNKLRESLRKELPEYMIPSYFVRINQIPLTPSGKVDYKNLPALSSQRPELSSEFEAASSPSQLMIERCWKKYLKVSPLGIDDSFFDLGGNSLMAIKILAEINQQVKKKISIVNFFQFPTIRLLGRFIEEKNDLLLPSVAKRETFLGDKDVAIIGMHGKFPGAASVDELWDMLMTQKNPLTSFGLENINPLVNKESAADNNYVRVQGLFPDQQFFDYQFFGMTPREAELMDPQQRKFLELAYNALEFAGHRPDKFPGPIGVFAGMGNSKFSRLLEEYKDKAAQLGDFNVMLGLEKDYIATRAAFKLNLKGPALSIHTGCSTSLVAVIEAVKSLRLGHCDMAIAGGISISGVPNSGHHFQTGGIFSEDGYCRPFDDNATGTIFTEGGGVVVLKRLNDAIKDKDNILAVIKGVGINNDGADKMSFTAPSVSGQQDAILKAQMDAGITADTIGYIEAHGTGTPIGDPIEVEALTNAFSQTAQQKQFCLLGSIKSNVGHLTAAAGVASLIKTIMTVQKGIVPGTAHFQTANRNLDLTTTPFIVSQDAQEFPVVSSLRRAGVSSFGVGGTNAHVILEEYRSSEQVENETTDGQATLFKLSARTAEQLSELRIKLINQLMISPKAEWRKIAYTLDTGRKPMKVKDYIVASHHQQLDALLLKKNNKSLKSDAQKVVLLFPGQGSQYSEMGNRLYSQVEIFRETFDLCNQLIGPHLGYDLRSFLHQSDDSGLLNNTFYSQPALFVIEYCLGKTIMELGYPVTALLGHSVGEYVAATLAGVFSLEDGLKTIALRARLMRDLPPGMMISLPLESEKALALASGLDLDLAAVNAEKSCVLAGSIDSIEQLKMRLESSSIAYVELKTSHAFHSRMMAPAVPLFQKFISQLQLKLPELELISSVTGKRETTLFTDPQYWASQIEKPVRFHEASSGVIKESERTIFVECGTRNVLSLLIKKAARNEIENGKIKVINLLGQNIEQESEKFFESLGEIWLEGMDYLQAEILYNSHEKQRTIAPVYPFNKTYCWPGPFDDFQPRKFNNEVNSMNDERLAILKEKLSDLFERSSGIAVNDYDGNTSFMEMGMDSLFLTQISLQLKKELKVNVSFRDLVEEYTTLNALADFLIDKTAAPGAPSTTPEKPEREPDHVPSEVPSPFPEPGPGPEPMPSPQPVPGPTPLSPGELPERTFDPVGINDDVRGIIQMQLDLMNRQLALLGKASTVSSSAKQVSVAVKSLVPKRGADIRQSKEAFGAQARIIVEKTAKISPEQYGKIQAFLDNYALKTRGSKKFTQENRKTHADPRAVTGFKPEWKEICYPIVVKKSKMQRLWDLDGNEYIDMTCGFGSNFFGNQNPEIKKYILQQMEDGIELGPQHPLTGEVSKMICELTGNERAAFCNTGSEAVLGAMRLARTVTGRDKIIVFSGSYHGINDEVILRAGKKGHANPAAPGINAEAVANMIVLDYGTNESLEKIRAMAHEVAAVLVEPVQSRRCNFHPVEFLKEVRKITSESQTCLIFDEIITGFRVHPAGAQGYFGIRADLCTYGKIIGGGMPIGVISGKAEYMDALDGGHWQYGDDSTPTVGVTYFAGTFVRHPIALAAAKGALQILKRAGVQQLADLNRKAQHFADELNRFLTMEKVPLEMNNFGSLMKPKWLNEVNGGELLFALLRYHGIHAYDGFPWFVNLAHTDEELNQVLEAFKKSVKTMQQFGLFESTATTMEEAVLPAQTPAAKVKVFDPMVAPAVGAKIGRDEFGNPAWFIENPDKTGEYFLLEG